MVADAIYGFDPLNFLFEVSLINVEVDGSVQGDNAVFCASGHSLILRFALYILCDVVLDLLIVFAFRNPKRRQAQHGSECH
jgi:hypothetical protein